MQPRIVWGLGAAFFGATLALDATMAAPLKYPLLVEAFGEHWDVARNIIFGVSSIGVAVCGFMAATVK